MAHEQRPALITYLDRNGCIVRRGVSSEPAELTHTLMNGASGGKICVHDGAVDGFYAAYGDDLARGHKLFVIERRSQIFNMHLDCDFKKIPSEQSLRAFVDVVHKTVALYFRRGNDEASPKAARCIACAVLADDKETRKAPGLHLMFPFAPVDEAAALWIRAGVVHALRDLRGFDGEEWSSVIDICVLTSSGLRMVGSDKCKTCSACKNTAENRPFCLPCKRTGKVAEEKVYWPYLAWPEDDTELQAILAQAKANPAHAARLCSTRRPAGTMVCKEFSVPDGAPAATTKRRLSKVDGDRSFGFSDEGPSLPRVKSSSPILLGPKQGELLLGAIRGFHPAYSKVEVKEVREWKKGSMAVVKVAGFGSRFCLNKGADHTGQSIYFVVTPLGGIAQRCFSRKDVQRQCGACASFTSSAKPISIELRLALFGEPSTQSQRIPSAPNNSFTELQCSRARVANLLAQLPPRLSRIRSAVPADALVSPEIPRFL